MRILDLFCGAGLVHDGLVAAGAEVVGVDLHPQPRYPGPFIQMDALKVDVRFARSFSAVWASPPCLRETSMKHAKGAKGDAPPELIEPTQRMLDSWGLPFVIENVENTERLRNPVVLCGSMFGLGVDDHGRRYHLERHRKIETNWPLPVPACAHQKPVVGVYGAHARVRAASFGGRGTADKWARGHQATMQEAMGVQRYMTCEELSQGVPPAYAEYVAKQLAIYLRRREAEAVIERSKIRLGF